MAQLTLFGFTPGNSRLHRMDVRYKLPMLALISLTIMATSLTGLTVLSLLLLALVVYLRLSIGRLLGEMRYFAVFLVFVGVTRLLAGWPPPVLVIWPAPPPPEALREAFRLCWQLSLIVLSSLLFTSTTRAADVRTALTWMLTPIPFAPARRVALMISLLVRFVPLVLQEARLLAEAQRARLIDLRKNPFYRLNCFATALLRRIFIKADQLTEALEARCFSETQSEPIPRCGYRDWGLLLPLLGVCGVLVWI